MTRRRVIPFKRHLRLGARGREVVAVKRALVFAGVGGRSLKGLTPLLGPFATRNLKAFQRRFQLQQTGVYNLATHRALAPFFDDYAAWLYNGARPAKPKSAGDVEREKIIAAALALYAIRDRVHYTQSSRRMQIVKQKLRPPFATPRDIYEDCSSSVTGLYFVAGAADPNGRGYDGLGYTGTLSGHGRVVRLEEARPGDLVFYGPGWPWGHVALYLGKGRVLSHGSERGPFLLPIDYRDDRGQIRSYIA